MPRGAGPLPSGIETYNEDCVLKWAVALSDPGGDNRSSVYGEARM
ncbi:MAG: hypothetical protein ACI9OJ_003059, partial [Myxococcota bacterium]